MPINIHNRPQKKYWSVEPSTSAQGGSAGELYLYGLICEDKWADSDVTPHELMQALNALGDISELNVHVFSNGGDVFAGNAIYSLLKQRKEIVNVYIEGIAASIASVIAEAGDNVYIAKNAMFMVHNPLLFLFGMFNKIDMTKMIADLDRVRDVVTVAYTEKTGLTAEEINALLDANGGDGTYLNASEAVAMGFCDAITPEAKAPKDMVAMVRPDVYSCRGHLIDLSIYNHAPKLTASVKPVPKGGKEMPKPRVSANTLAKGNPKAARRGRFKAELVDLQCPHCEVKLNFDTGSGIISVDPTEAATVATPLEAEAVRRGGYSNEVFSIECPACGGEFEYDTDPDGAVIPDDTVFNPNEPLVQARVKKSPKAKTKVKPKAKNRFGVLFRMQDEPPAEPSAEPSAEPESVPITCTECGTEFTIDVDPTIEEAVVVCPNCSTELDVDTSDVGTDGGETAPSEEAMIVAFRKGMRAERQRMMMLDERAAAFPQFAEAIDGFKRNGSSVECASNWIFKALAANPSASQSAMSGSGYLAAARRDADPLKKVASPARGDNKAAAIAENYDSLAKRRGTKKNG